MSDLTEDSLKSALAQYEAATATPDVMVDIETLGTRHDAAILSIGAVAFDIRTQPLGGFRSFVGAVSIGTALERGTITPSTIQWWFEHPKAQEAWLQTVKEPLSKVLERFRHWYKEVKAKRIWANGATFDTVILTNAYHTFGQGTPWHYRDVCDQRTLNFLGKVEKADWEEARAAAGRVLALAGGFVEHDPLSDAFEQVFVAKMAYSRLYSDNLTTKAYFKPAP